MSARAFASLRAFLLALLMAPPLHAAALVVNEVQTEGANGGADEFVEIANTSPDPIDLNGYKIVYRSGAGTSDQVLFTFVSGALIPPGGVMVFGGEGYTGPRDGTFTRALSTEGGGIGIRNAADALIDSMAYGNATNAFVEGVAAIAPESAHSLHRTPCGRDTNMNRADFQDQFPPTPKEPCAGNGGPRVDSAAFTPNSVGPGASATLRVRIVLDGSALASVQANLSAIGGGAATSLTRNFDDTWSTIATVSSDAPYGPRSILVTATDMAGRKGYAAAALAVVNPLPGDIVINEFQTGGATADTEFVELYNRTGADIDLTGYKLVYRAATGQDDASLHTFGAVTIKARGYYLLGTDAFSGPKDDTMSANMARTAGGVALKDTTGGVVDAVGYGQAANGFVENAPAPAPPDGGSLARVSAGEDTNNNAVDFVVSNAPTPTTSGTKPVVSGVRFSPTSLDPGGTCTLAATVTPGAIAVKSVVADLTALGGSYTAPLSHDGGETWSVSFTVARHTTPGNKTVAVTARNAEGGEGRASGLLVVNNAVPPPALKVNEVKASGASGDEFVELFNPTAADVKMVGWTLVYRSGAGATDGVLFSFGTHVLRAGGYLLITGNGHAGDRDGTLGNSLSDTGASIGLRDPFGRIVDAVGYGTAQNTLTEGAPAPAPQAGGSIERAPAGTDTNDNSRDFHPKAAPTPISGVLKKRGDVNKDGAVDIRDAALALKIAGSLSKSNTAAVSAPNGDVWPAPNGDGRITMRDALRIVRAVEGRETL